MKGRLVLGIFASVAVCAAAAVAASGTVLFDGRSLDHFVSNGQTKWVVANGYVEGKDTECGFLVTRGSYKDFDLTLDVWVSPDANSGVFFRCENPKEITDTSCYEANIFDQRPDQTYRTGAITHIAPPKAKIDAGGRWNTFEIRAEGDHLVLTLDGTVTVDVRDAKHGAAGAIALQYGNGTIRFRNVKLTPLE